MTFQRIREVEFLFKYIQYIVVRAIRSRRMRWAGRIARMWERIGAYKVLVGNLKEGDHFWMQGVEWIDMAQDRDRWRVLVNAVMNIRVP